MQKVSNKLCIQQEVNYLPECLRGFPVLLHRTIFFLRILGKVSAVTISHDLAAKENVHIPKRKRQTQWKIQNIKHSHDELFLCSSSLNFVCAHAFCWRVVQGEEVGGKPLCKMTGVEGNFWLYSGFDYYFISSLLLELFKNQANFTKDLHCLMGTQYLSYPN